MYLAARYITKDKIKSYAEKLITEGHEITSSWLSPEDDQSDGAAALRDLIDIQEADALVSFTEEPSIGYNTGGRHVEFGAAWVWGKKLIIVGPKENIFHHLEGVIQVKNFDELRDYLKGK